VKQQRALVASSDVHFRVAANADVHCVCDRCF